MAELDIPETTEGARRAPPSMAAAWLLLAAAGALFFAGRAAPLQMAHLVFFALSIGLCAVSVFAFAARAVGGEASASLKASFRSLFDAAEHPAAVTDRNVEVLAANKAAKARLRKGEGPTFAAELFGPWAHDIDSTIYRLANKALKTGEAVEPLNSPTPLLMRARRFSGGDLLWTIEGAAVDLSLDIDSAPYGYARIDTVGAVREANGVFKSYTQSERTAIVSAVARAAEAGQASAGIDLESGRRVSMAIHGGTMGELHAFVFPEWAALSHGREAIFDQMPVALVRLTPDGRIISVNAAARALLGDGAQPGVVFETLVDGFGRRISDRITDAMSNGGSVRPELARAETDERDVYLQISLAKMDFDGGASLLAVMSDATEHKSLEQQFTQSQKMQAVGQLAGGVAHDFNNLLTAILGHTDLLMLRVAEGEPEFADLSQIKQNANRAAALVRQLLAFSRKQTLRPEAVAIPEAVSELSHLLNRLLGERVVLRQVHGDGLWPVMIDRPQFEQVIVNLVVNARDAMPDGGEVTIISRNLVLDEEEARGDVVVPAAEYVEIRVSDTGVGIRPDRLDKIFEPFFTTKEVGEGTGLGLSTAYGIIKQMSGFIFAESNVGEGSSFTILLPRPSAEDDVEPIVEIIEEAAEDLTGSGVVLLVEDEAPVRAFARRALTMRGYDVVEAESAEDALEKLALEGGRIDLIISDVVMPGEDGPSWVRKAQAAQPDLSVIFISGYAEDVFRKGMDGIEDYSFLPKPFSLDELAVSVKRAMDQKAEAEPAA